MSRGSQSGRSDNEYWACDCGEKLPKTGMVWRSRFMDWIQRGKPEDSGYRCDYCADCIEQGIDVE